MACKVGIPCMKCSLHPSTQVNSRTGKAAKTCGVNSAWKEMNDERLGRDTTIDRSLTDQNVWMSGHSTDDVPQKVQTEIDWINEERRANGLRALRKDAVSVAEIVEKPPITFMQDLSYEERVKFLYDSHETMKDLIHEWNPNWKILASVQHHDEFGGLSAHNHTLVLLSSEDANGIPTMRAKSEFNLKFFDHINKNYAERMRARGYDIEDCRTYDRLSEEEKMERKLHPEEHGVDAYTYKQKRMAEDTQKLQELKIKTAEMTGKLSEAKTALDETVQQITNAPSLDSYQKILSENTSLRQELSIKDKIIERLQAEKQKLTETIASLKESLSDIKEKFSDISQKAGRRLMSLFGYESDSSMKLREYPSKDVSEGIREMTSQIKEIDPRKCRVIPDDEDSQKFRVAIRGKDGLYRTLQGGFTDRASAELWKRDLSDASLHLTDQLEGVHKGIHLK